MILTKFDISDDLRYLLDRQRLDHDAVNPMVYAKLTRIGDGRVFFAVHRALDHRNGLECVIAFDPFRWGTTVALLPGDQYEETPRFMPTRLLDLPEVWGLHSPIPGPRFPRRLDPWTDETTTGE